MDLTLSPSEEEFRDEVRTWLQENNPGPEPEGSLDEVMTFRGDWQRKLHAAGWAGISWPKEYGGRGATMIEQAIFVGEAARQEAPSPANVLGLAMGGPVVIAHGTEAQKERYLEPILTGEEIWCQGFSEPNAGSDLASLKTRAERRGDRYIVNGQKIWSSNAQYARYCLLLARTDPNAAKHRGISYFILDLNSPGVTRRPIQMLTGGSHFCEVFLDNVEIPAENLIGAENEGWKVAQATLSSERGLTILELCERMRIAFDLLVRDAQSEVPRSAFEPVSSAGRRWIDDDQIRRSLVEIHTRIQALRLLINNMLTRVLRKGSTGTEPSIIKVYYSELLQDFTELGVRMGGLDAQYVQSVLMGGGYETGYWMHDHLYSWSWTIAGGSNEIQRNIIAERGLGLPRDSGPGA